MTGVVGWYKEGGKETRASSLNEWRWMYKVKVTFRKLIDQNVAGSKRDYAGKC